MASTQLLIQLLKIKLLLPLIFAQFFLSLDQYHKILSLIQPETTSSSINALTSQISEKSTMSGPKKLEDDWTC